MSTRPNAFNGERVARVAPARRPRSLKARRASPAALVSLVCAFALAAAVGASAHSPHAGSATKVVKLRNVVFTPERLTIKAKTKVTWRWLDRTTIHNVTSEPNRHGLRFKNSGDKTKGGVYSVTFKKPGVYYYECTIHPLSMQGEIIVR